MLRKMFVLVSFVLIAALYADRLRPGCHHCSPRSRYPVAPVATAAPANCSPCHSSSCDRRSCQTGHD